MLIVRDIVNAIDNDKELLNELTNKLRRVTDKFKQKATVNKQKVSESSIVFPITEKCTKK